MKRSSALLIVVTLGLVLLSVGCGASLEKKSSHNSNASASRLTVTLPLSEEYVADTIKLGRLHEGEILTSAFTIENKSNAPIVIVDVMVDCGCTQTRFDSAPIMVGESRRVDFAFDSSNREGTQQKFMEVKLAGGKDFRVYFNADVI